MRRRKFTIGLVAFGGLAVMFSRLTGAISRTLEGSAPNGTGIPLEAPAPTARRKPARPILPNLLLAGVQKSGTTAVDNYMREHDFVCSAQEKREMNGFKYTSSKEVHFFDIKERFSKGIDFYIEHYNHCNFASDNKFLIDSTPNYQLHPERIYESYKKFDPEGLGNLKIIFTVREPVAREMSWFNHWSNSYRWLSAFPKGYQPTFTKDYYPQLLQKRNKKTLKGYYFKWFQRWFTLFDRKNILILAYDEIKRHPERAMRRVHEFLDIPLPPAVVAVDEADAGSNRDTNIAASGVITNHKQTDFPDCARQETILQWFQEDTDQFYKLLEEYPGPSMEQRPFPKFQFSCYKEPGAFAKNT